MQGFFDDYNIFQNSSGVGNDINRLNTRYKAIIESNAEIIAQNRILDLASHDGRWSFAAIKNDAKHVLGIEGRQHLVDKANQIFNNLEVNKNQFEFRRGLIPQDLQSIKENFDVVLCLGFFYHTVEHR